MRLRRASRAHFAKPTIEALPSCCSLLERSLISQREPLDACNFIGLYGSTAFGARAANPFSSRDRELELRLNPQLIGAEAFGTALSLRHFSQGRTRLRRAHLEGRIRMMFARGALLTFSEKCDAEGFETTATGLGLRVVAS